METTYNDVLSVGMCPKMRPVGVTKKGKKDKLSCVKLAICPDHPRRPLNSINRLEGASLRAVARWPEARGRPYWQGHVIVVYIRSALIFMFLSLYLVLSRLKTGEKL